MLGNSANPESQNGNCHFQGENYGSSIGYSIHTMWGLADNHYWERKDPELRNMGLHDIQHWDSVTRCWDWLIPLLGTERSRVTQHGITRFPALGIHHTMLGSVVAMIGN